MTALYELPQATQDKIDLWKSLDHSDMSTFELLAWISPALGNDEHQGGLSIVDHLDLIDTIVARVIAMAQDDDLDEMQRTRQTIGNITELHTESDAPDLHDSTTSVEPTKEEQHEDVPDISTGPSYSDRGPS